MHVRVETQQIVYLSIINSNGYFSILNLEIIITGGGFFTVEKSTLTAMLSTSLTYFIILLQFQSED